MGLYRGYDLRDDELDEGVAWEQISRPLGRAVDDFANCYELSGVCESPIEIMLVAQLLRFARDEFEVIPQFWLGKYRYDFCVRYRARPDIALLIECDGKAFHSSTAAIENDRRKDDLAQKSGYGILRITGSDINADARNCATYALDRLRRRKLFRR